MYASDVDGLDTAGSDWMWDVDVPLIRGWLPLSNLTDDTREEPVCLLHRLSDAVTLMH